MLSYLVYQAVLRISHLPQFTDEQTESLDTYCSSSSAVQCVHACVLSLSRCLQSPGLQPTRPLCPWDYPGKNTRVCCHFLLQGLFLTQGWNLCLQHLLHWKVDSLPMSHLRSLAVQWWFLYYSFVNRGIQNYCGQCVVMCSGTEGSVSGYELCLSLSQTLFSFPVIHLKVAM